MVARAIVTRVRNHLLTCVLEMCGKHSVTTSTYERHKYCLSINALVFTRGTEEEPIIFGGLDRYCLEIVCPHETYLDS